jgi:hypothetical protein
VALGRFRATDERTTGRPRREMPVRFGPWQSVPRPSTCVQRQGLFKVVYGRVGRGSKLELYYGQSNDRCVRSSLGRGVWGTRTLAIHPIIIKLACVAVVVVIVFPLGMMVFPYIADEMGGTPFKALEAMVSATLGLGLYAALFG